VETFVVLADYQVITDRESPGAVRENILEAVRDNLAAGLDPERTVFFTHSSIPELNQLMLPFLSLVTDAELRRNPTVKAEAQDSGRALGGLLLTYPVHQAADILFCKGNTRAGRQGQSPARGDDARSRGASTNGTPGSSRCRKGW
jgi:tryptophanyl-tRNA synthetase